MSLDSVPNMFLRSLCNMLAANFTASDSFSDITIFTPGFKLISEFSELQENNEKHAVFAAIEMMETLTELNNKYHEKFKHDIQMGIGINYGEVVVGNVGSEDKIEFAVTGDTVNTGKRIEMITKDHPNMILVRDNVYEKTRDLIQAKKWEPLFVKGKKEKINVYEILKRKDI